MADDKARGTEAICGLPMFTAADPETLARERDELSELEKKPLGGRWRGYFSKTGPGWLQAGITLGGGSAIASLYCGAHYQYRLLWVQPLAMLVGVIVDVPETQTDFLTWLQSVGFREERSFIRMYRGENEFPGDPSRIFGIAGPELG